MTLKTHLMLLLCFCCYITKGQEFFGDKNSKIFADPALLKDAAIQLIIADLSEVMQNPAPGSPLLKGSSITKNAIVLALTKSRFSQKPDSLSALPEESFFLKKTSFNGQPALLISGGSIRGLCYGAYYVHEQVKLKNYSVIQNEDFYRNPDFKFRMITQPFEVTGFKNVSNLAKPIIREREFDPMRPFDGAGYTAEDEAKNILRSGLNTIYIGSYTFVTTYDSFSKDVFPQQSEGRKWVEQRRKKYRELIAAAEKYHLQVCVNSDIFAYPLAVKHADRWKALSASLNEVLTDFPQIDYVIARFGENYSYFNPYFTGKGPEDKQELTNAIDFISDIVVNKYHKIFIPRTWSLGNNSLHADPRQYLEVINKVQANKGVYFSIKNTQTDFWRYNRFNPSLGIGNKKQAIEYLCQDGYNFKSSVPYYEVIRMARGSKEIDVKEAGMKKAKAMGIDYTWGWLTADGWCGPYLKREEWLKANIFGYTHLMWDVNQDPEILATKWAALEFNVPIASKAASNIAAILMLSENMILKTRYFKNFSTNHTGWVPALNWMRDDMIGGGDTSFKNPGCRFSNKPGIIRPIFNPATVDEDCAEKREALYIANLMLEKFDEIKNDIPDQVQATEMRNTLVSCKYLIGTLCYYINGMFRYYNNQPQEAKRYLQQWQLNWKKYQEVSELPGAPTPMVNGGMVETCMDAMKGL